MSHISLTILFSRLTVRNFSFIPKTLSCWPGYLTPRTKSTTLEIQDELRKSLEWWLSPHQQHISSSFARNLSVPGFPWASPAQRWTQHQVFSRSKPEKANISVRDCCFLPLFALEQRRGEKKEEKGCRIEQSCIERVRIWYPRNDLSLPPNPCLLEQGGYSAAAWNRSKGMWICAFGRTFQIQQKALWPWHKSSANSAGVQGKKNCKQTSLTCLAAEKNTHKGDF